MTQPLADRVAIVTGGGRGLGREIAAQYVAAGARVLITGRDQAVLDATASELGVEALRADVAKAEDCARVVERAEALGPVSILVNNAGVYGPMGAIDQVDWDEWVEAMQINLFGTVLMTRAVLPGLRAREYGKIVNLSGGGATAPLPRISAYAASKAAVVRLTETFSEELREVNVDVNAIAPGALNTRLLDEVLEAGPGAGRRRLLRQGDQAARHRWRRARARRGARRVPRLGRERRHQRTAAERPLGRLGRTCRPGVKALMASDVYTLRRIVPEDRPQLGSTS